MVLNFKKIFLIFINLNHHYYALTNSNFINTITPNTTGSPPPDASTTLFCNFTMADFKIEPAQQITDELINVDCRLSLVTVYRLLNILDLADKLYIYDNTNYFVNNEDYKIIFKRKTLYVRGESMFFNMMNCSCLDLRILNTIKLDAIEFDDIGLYLIV